MEVCVVVPVFNRPEFVVRAIRSVLDQSHPPAQIVVVDDASEDDTPDRLEAFGSRIQILTHTRRRGVAAARNSALAAARCPWIAFLDSDDVWLPHKLERQCAYHAAHPEYPISHTYERWIRGEKEVPQKAWHRRVEGDFFEANLHRCTVSPSTVLVRKSVLEEVGGFDERFVVCEDHDLWLRLARHHPIGLVPEALTIKHAGAYPQLSRTPMIELWRIEALRKHLPDPRVKEVLAHKCALVRQGARKHRNEAVLAYLDALECMLFEGS